MGASMPVARVDCLDTAASLLRNARQGLLIEALKRMVPAATRLVYEACAELDDEGQPMVWFEDFVLIVPGDDGDTELHLPAPDDPDSPGAEATFEHCGHLLPEGAVAEDLARAHELACRIASAHHPHEGNIVDLDRRLPPGLAEAMDHLARSVIQQHRALSRREEDMAHPEAEPTA